MTDQADTGPIAGDARTVAVWREIQALRAERDRAFTERDIADATRIRIAAELAAARDQIAAVAALHTPTADGHWCDGCRCGWPCDTARLLAALSQSGQPTKETP